MIIYTIYMATNVVNGKQYIGFDSAWPKRKATHLSNAFSKTNRNQYYFHSAIRKYGKENFEWLVLYQSLDGEYAKNVMEQYFITEYRTYTGFTDSNGYNLTLGGDGVLGRFKPLEARGKPGKRSRTVSTPYGVYNSITQAELATNVLACTIRKRANSPFYHDWYYVDSPKLLKDKSMRTTTRSRQICTPMGTFASIKIASNNLDMRADTIMFKLKSTHQLDWHYVDNPKIPIDHIVKGSRAIITPLGIFGSVAMASKATSLHPSTINRRLNSPNYPDWYFVNK